MERWSLQCLLLARRRPPGCAPGIRSRPPRGDLAYAKMSAKAWELRATTCLASLLRDSHRGDEARKTLAEIYTWFTEGFDAADLKEA